MEVELAWAAGFFDGEGCVCRRNQHNEHDKINFEVAQVDVRPLERFLAAVKIGKIIHRPGGKKSGPHYMFVLYRQEHVYDVINKLWPFLSEPKKEQIIRNTNVLTFSSLAT